MAINIPEVGEFAFNAQDKFFDETNLPDTTNLDSSVFKFGGSQGGVELIITADVEVTNGAAIIFDLYHSADENGSYVLYKQLVSVAAATYPAGTEFVRELPETDVEQWAKVKVTTTETLAAMTITGNLHFVER